MYVFLMYDSVVKAVLFLYQALQDYLQMQFSLR